MKPNLIFILFLWLGVTNIVSGQNANESIAHDQIIDVSKVTSDKLLGKYLFYTEDVPPNYTINQVEGLIYKHSNKDLLNLGFSETSGWVRFTIKNSSSNSFERILSIAKPLQDTIQLFYKKDYQWQVSNTGYMVNTKDKAINASALYFPLTFDPHSETTYYLRTRSKYGRSYAVKLLDETNFDIIERRELIIVCLLIGILITICFYNVVLGWALRDSIYLLYGGTVIGGLLTQLAVRGFFKEFLIDELPFIQEWCAPFFIAGGTIVTAQFCIKFLNTEKYDKLSHILLKSVIWFQFTAFFYELIRHEVFGYYTTNKLVAIGLMVFSFLALFSGIRVYRAGNRSAKYLVFAWSSYCATIVMYVCTLLVLMPINLVTVNAYVIGSVLEAVLLSLAVADRYRTLENEKLDLVTELISKEQDISIKSQEIMKLQMESVKQLRSKIEIANNLKKLAEDEEGITLKSVLAQVRSTNLEDKKALVLKQQIVDFNEDFIAQLKDRFPELSKTEVELATFSRIKLTRKEISELRGTTIHAVKSGRQRLKKKLGLKATQSLDDFLELL